MCSTWVMLPSSVMQNSAILKQRRQESSGEDCGSDVSKEDWEVWHLDWGAEDVSIISAFTWVNCLGPGSLGNMVRWRNLQQRHTIWVSHPLAAPTQCWGAGSRGVYSCLLSITSWLLKLCLSPWCTIQVVVVAAYLLGKWGCWLKLVMGIAVLR